jgi:sucrose-6F-phosphate phosphohydrolase
LSKEDWLIVCDLDGTLLGDDAALAAFRHWRHTCSDARLAYATGRTLQSVQKCLDETSLPEADILITSIGTEILQMPEATPLFPWPVLQGRNWDRSRLVRQLTVFTQLELQPLEFQNPWKASYFLNDSSAAFLEEISQHLAAEGLEFESICSCGKYLDFLPFNSDKGAAVAATARHLSISSERVIVAGDSGNDISMFTRGFRSIIVANAQPEVKSRRFPMAYHAQASFAAGVLEGLEHWGVRSCP